MIAPTAPTAAPPVRRYGAVLGRYLAPQRGPALLLAVLLLAGIGLQLAVPQVLRTFIDTATGVASGSLPADAGSGLARLAGVFLALALGTQVLGGAATVLGAAVGWNATNLLRRDLLDHCLRLDMTFHAARTSGEMIERIDGDVTALSDFFAQFAVRLRDVAVSASAREREAVAQVFGFVEERLTGIDDVRANGAGAHALHRFVAVMRTFFADTRRAWMARSIVWLSTYGLFVVGVLVTIGSGIQLVLVGAITLATAYMVFQYLVLLQAPIEQITHQMQVLQRAGASLGRIDELLRERSRLTPLDAARRTTLPPGPLEVRFDAVGFRYHDADEDAPPNLRGIDLTVPAGTHLGLLGRTGSGKTTLTRLAFRFYDPDQGRVVLAGVDARDVPLAELRRRVGLVTQEVQLVQGSVRDNLTFFDDTVADARLLAALEEVGLGDWLESLPYGLDTAVRAGGGNLSAGEAQLLAMARVFLGDPGLVLLDEPSSRLDPATERRLELALERLLRGRTAVTIAHRLDTVDRVDAVAVLDDGAVIEHGPRAALAAEPTTRYARLLRAAHGAASGAASGADDALEELA